MKRLIFGVLFISLVAIVATAQPNMEAKLWKMAKKEAKSGTLANFRGIM